MVLGLSGRLDRLHRRGLAVVWLDHQPGKDCANAGDCSEYVEGDVEAIGERGAAECAGAGVGADVARRDGGRDRCDDGDADRAADLLGRVD
jgi:hypothetical protein